MSFHPDDRPDPAEQPIRARVPDHVAGGCFSTGVIVMTAQTEFILDFVQNLGRPHQIVARVVMPHGVLPQLVDALGRNIQLYRSRWGELPHPNITTQTLIQAPLPGSNPQVNNPPRPSGAVDGGAQAAPGTIQPFPASQGPQPSDASQSGTAPQGSPQGNANPQQHNPNAPESTVRQASAQEIYDDLKIRDELLSGNYANAVMIGHGPHEFSFDFITNFYPHSAVSSRVFLAAGQIPRLHDSLKGTWEQLRLRMQQPPNNPPPQPPLNDPPPGWLG